MPELIQNLPVVMIPFAILAFFYYQSNLKWMQERREIAEAILVERKELADAVLTDRREIIHERDQMLIRSFAAQDKQSERYDRLATAVEKSTGEDHALRNRLSEHLLKDESFRIRSERVYLMLEKHFGINSPGGTDG